MLVGPEDEEEEEDEDEEVEERDHKRKEETSRCSSRNSGIGKVGI